MKSTVIKSIIEDHGGQKNLYGFRLITGTDIVLSGEITPDGKAEYDLYFNDTDNVMCVKTQTFIASGPMVSVNRFVDCDKISEVIMYPKEEVNSKFTKFTN